jgi:hypothetical protein
VRVVRAVPEGYRYDGLYRVADAWHEKGKSGFQIWRYRLVAIDAAVPAAPLAGKQEELFDDGSNRRPARRQAPSAA